MKGGCMTIEKQNEIADMLYQQYEQQRPGSHFSKDSFRPHVYSFLRELPKQPDNEAVNVSELVKVLFKIIY